MILYSFRSSATAVSWHSAAINSPSGDLPIDIWTVWTSSSLLDGPEALPHCLTASSHCATVPSYSHCYQNALGILLQGCDTAVRHLLHGVVIYILDKQRHVGYVTREDFLRMLVSRDAMTISLLKGE